MGNDAGNDPVARLDRPGPVAHALPERVSRASSLGTLSDVATSALTTSPLTTFHR